MFLLYFVSSENVFSENAEVWFPREILFEINLELHARSDRGEQVIIDVLY